MIIIGALVKITLHTGEYFHGKDSLNLAAAESAGHLGALPAMIRISRAVLFPAAFLEFPTIHLEIPCDLSGQQIIYFIGIGGLFLKGSPI